MYDRIPYLTQPAAGMGYDFGIYALTALFTILEPVVEVSGKSEIRKPIRMNELRDSPNFGEQYEVKGENIMVGHMEFQNGVLGTVMFNGNCIFPEKPYIAVQGTNGILYLPDPNQFGGKVFLQKQIWGGSEDELELINSYTENSRGLGVSVLLRSFENGEATNESMMKAAHAIEVLEGFVESGKTKTFIAINSSFKKDKNYIE
jgi:predicted dehydrogenase